MAGFHTKTFIKHDDYMTPESAWINIKEYIPKNRIIWEAFYGDGKSSEYLEKLGFNVIHNQNDFFKSNEGEIVVSNPPFSQKKEVLTRLKQLDKPFILICPSMMLSYKYFQTNFKDKNIQLIIPYKRMNFKHLNSNKKNYSPPFASFYYCYKMNLPKDIIFLE